MIPNATCGCIIGKGGATIRSFVEDSAAEIKLSSQDRMLPGVTDRILTVTGAIEQVLRAVALVATALAEDDGYHALAARWGAPPAPHMYCKSPDRAHCSNKHHKIRVIPQLKPLKQAQLKRPNKQPLNII